MKKIFVLLILIMISTNVSAMNINKEKITVTLKECIDGDTAKFNYGKNELKVRFLAINTPETKGEEKYGKEASDFTCDKLGKAKEIIIEFDPNSDLTDKYGRYLGWIFIDGSLLQKELINKGLAEVKYLYGNYKYTEELKIAEAKAKNKKIGIWEDEKPMNYKLLILMLLIIIVLCLISKKFYKKIKRKIKKKIKNSRKLKF